MGGRALKRRLRQALASPDWERLPGELAAEPTQQAVTALLAALSSGQDIVRWRAVIVLGGLVALRAEADPEAGREVMRRLVWGLNEESGAVAWGAPEAMGEIMARSRRMAQEFANLLLAYLVPGGPLALDFPPLKAGAVWGLGRLCQARPRLMQERRASYPLLALLDDPAPQVRGLAAWALGHLGDGGGEGGGDGGGEGGGDEAGDRLARLVADQAELDLFNGRELKRARVGELAREALDRLNK